MSYYILWLFSLPQTVTSEDDQGPKLFTLTRISKYAIKQQAEYKSHQNIYRIWHLSGLLSSYVLYGLEKPIQHYVYIEKASPRQDSDSLNIAHEKEWTERGGACGHWVWIEQIKDIENWRHAPRHDYEHATTEGTRKRNKAVYRTVSQTHVVLNSPQSHLKQKYILLL